MNIENIYRNSDLNKSSSNKLDWQLIQNEMKKKFIEIEINFFIFAPIKIC